MPQVAPASRNAPAEPRPCLCLRPAAVVAACFLLVAAVVLAYLGGVMSGRATWRSLTVQAQAAADDAGDGKSAKKAPAAAEPGAGQGILAAEDLRFARVLRGESLPPAKPAAAPSAPVAAAAPGAAPAQPAAPPAAPQSPAPAVAPAAVLPLAPGGGMSDYVFQVGAFKDEDSVDGLRQRLEGRGLRTRMERSGKFYVVLVLLRGDQTRAEEVVRTAESMGLGKPIQRSRKVVVQP